MLLDHAVLQQTNMAIPVEFSQFKFLCLSSPGMAGNLLKTTPVAEQFGSALDKCKQKSAMLRTALRTPPI